MVSLPILKMPAIDADKISEMKPGVLVRPMIPENMGFRMIHLYDVPPLLSKHSKFPVAVTTMSEDQRGLIIEKLKLADDIFIKIFFGGALGWTRANLLDIIR